MLTDLMKKSKWKEVIQCKECGKVDDADNIYCCKCGSRIRTALGINPEKAKFVVAKKILFRWKIRREE